MRIKRKKMTDERIEITLGDGKIYLNEDNIMCIDVVGDLPHDLAIPLKEGVLKLMDRVPGKVDVLTDLNKAGKPSAKVREVGRQLAGNSKMGKIALFGIHPVARMIAFFWMSKFTRQDMRFFKTKEEALAWIEE